MTGVATSDGRREGVLTLAVLWVAHSSSSWTSSWSTDHASQAPGAAHPDGPVSDVAERESRHSWSRVSVDAERPIALGRAERMICDSRSSPSDRAEIPPLNNQKARTR
jgi:hypothetical protein